MNFEDVAFIARLIVNARCSPGEHSASLILESFMSQGLSRRPDFSRIASSLGGHILIADALLEETTREFRSLLLAFLEECLRNSGPSAARAIAKPGMLNFLWHFLESSDDQESLRIAVFLFGRLLPFSFPWIRKLMSRDCIQILSQIPANALTAQIFWVMIADDGNLTRSDEVALIVNQCMRFLLNDELANVEIALRILSTLVEKRKSQPDRFVMEVVLQAVARAIREVSDVGILSECINFLKVLNAVPATFVVTVAEFCLPSRDRSLSINALDLIDANSQMFTTSEDLAMLQTRFVEGLMHRLEEIRQKDVDFFLWVIERQDLAVFDTATIEVLLCCVAKKWKESGRLFRLLIRVAEQCRMEGGQRMSEFQDKLAEYDLDVDLLLLVDPMHKGSGMVMCPFGMDTCSLHPSYFDQYD
jgi:hypothetical protein